MGKLLTLLEAAELLRKSEAQMRWMIHKGSAPRSALIGGRRMFDEDLLNAWVLEQFEKASA